MATPARIEPPGTFPSTCWSEFQAGTDAQGRSRALETLARDYARPIEAWLCAECARDAEVARELAQGFFLWAIESDFLAKADRARGSFRGFLKVALRHFATDHARRAGALKRGGGREHVALDAAGDGAAPELADPKARTPDEQLDRAWRAELVSLALARTEAELASAGRARSFAVFQAYFLDPNDGADYRALAERFGIAAHDVSNDLARAKQSYREHLRRLVLDTVGSRDALESELAWLVGPAAT